MAKRVRWGCTCASKTFVREKFLLCSMFSIELSSGGPTISFLDVSRNHSSINWIRGSGGEFLDAGSLVGRLGGTVEREVFNRRRPIERFTSKGKKTG